MRDYTKLRAFELADEIAILTYRETKNFPKGEMYGLTSQMRRAAVSVPSNIVEGCSRESQGEFLRFLEIAFSSLRELHYQFSLSKRLGYLRENNFAGCELKLIESEKVLGALIRSLRSPNRLQSKQPESLRNWI
ncbi:MAG: four helix bundle protein [Nitrospiria bacterium]